MKLGKVIATTVNQEVTWLHTESEVKVKIPLKNLSWMCGEELELSRDSNHIIWNGEIVAAVTSGSLECFAFPKALQHARERKEDAIR